MECFLRTLTGWGWCAVPRSQQIRITSSKVLKCTLDSGDCRERERGWEVNRLHIVILCPTLSLSATVNEGLNYPGQICQEIFSENKNQQIISNKALSTYGFHHK